MAVNMNITGGGQNKTATVFEGGTPNRFRPTGLVTYTEPFEITNYEGIFATDADGNNNLAIDGTAFPALEDGVHNGGDTAYWTPTASVGTWDFASGTQANTGSASISGTATTNGATARFDRASSIDPADYVRLEGFIYIDSEGTGGGTKALNIQLYDSANTPLNGVINIYDYITLSNTGVWQQFQIPLSVFGDIGNDVDRLDLIVTNTSGQPVDFYLDDIMFSSQGGREFFIRPFGGELTKVYALELVITATDSTTRDNDVNPLGFGFGSSLTQGIVFKRNQVGYPEQAFPLLTNLSMLSFPGADMTFLVGDGTTAAMKLRLPYNVPLELNNLNDDYLSLIVQDDLSSNISITFSAVAATVRKPDLTSF